MVLRTTGGGWIFYGICAVLLGSGFIFPEIGRPYSYPQSRVKLAKARAVRQDVRLQFWTSGFV